MEDMRKWCRRVNMVERSYTNECKWKNEPFFNFPRNGGKRDKE
jgi:hypothetical protein